MSLAKSSTWWLNNPLSNESLRLRAGICLGLFSLLLQACSTSPLGDSCHGLTLDNRADNSLIAQWLEGAFPTTIGQGPRLVLTQAGFSAPAGLVKGSGLKSTLLTYRAQVLWYQGQALPIERQFRQQRLLVRQHTSTPLPNQISRHENLLAQSVAQQIMQFVREQCP